MSLITWNDYFVTGIDIIDEQHRWLIGLINRAAEVLIQPYARNHDAADQLLDQLTDYAVFHFRTEGELMVEYGIDPRHSRHHVASHGDFATHVTEMRERYQRTGDVSGGELLTFLANWLIFHILSDDQVLGRQLVAIRNGMPPAEAFEKAEGIESDPAIQAKTKALIDLYQLINLQYSNLQAVYQELEDHRDNLELMVSQRTEQLAQARDQAEAASRAKSAFLANMSHEFRTPMNAIAGMCWALQKDVGDPVQREKLQIIARASQRLQDMLAEVLDMVKLESAQLTLEPVDFSLAELLDHICGSAAISAAAKGLHFEAELQPGLPNLVNGDARRIGQMLGHLLSNAVKYTDRGNITLRAETVGAPGLPRQIRLSIIDTGKGIAAADLGRIFMLFEQLDASSSRQQGGAGLGLAICRRIARLMGGDIEVSSELGHGSRFTLSVPFRPAATSPASAAATATAGGRSAGGKQHPPDLRSFRARLEQLRPLVAEDDIRAIALWSRMAAGARAALGPLAAQLGNEIEAYNFPGALKLLDDALYRLPTGNEQKTSV